MRYLCGMDKIGQVLAELRDERERLAADLARVGRAIEALEQAAVAVAPSDGAEAHHPAPKGMVSVTFPRQPAPGPAPYAAMNLYEATAHCLGTREKPQNARQIAEALMDGGFKTRSGDFAGTVRTMLRRPARRGSRITPTSDGRRWFLRE
jgi:hypothetical protein